jgi:drug/metabolite transporter (DMT)-like permease
MRLKADLTLLAVAVIWGSAFITQGIAAKYQLAWLFNGVSFILASIVLLPFLPRPLKIQPGQWKWMLVAGLALFAATGLQQVGIFYTKIANAGFLTSLYTVFTPFLLWLIFRERPHWIDVLAVLGAGLGAFFLSTGGRFQIQPGDALEFCGAVFWGLHVVVVGKFASRYEPLSFASGHFLITGLLNLLVGLIFEAPAQLLLLPVLGAILYRAILSIGVGFTLQVWGQRHTPPTDAALILSLEAIVAVAAGWFLMDQTLLPVQLAGCLLIFVSVLFSQLKGTRLASHA